MTTMRHHWRTRSWSPPDFFGQLLREAEIECIDELIRSFTYFTCARLQLLSDARALTEREALSELLTLKDSCRQVGADRMAFLCGEIEKHGLNPETDGFRYLMEALREEGHCVLHDMRVYTIGLKRRALSAAACGPSQRGTTDSVIASTDSRNDVIPLSARAELRQRISRAHTVQA
jgi:hypothetical protein